MMIVLQHQREVSLLWATVFLCVPGRILAQQQGDVNCSIPSVHQGQTAELDCQFPMDPLEKSFRVKRFQEKKKLPVVLMNCNYDKDNSSFSCTLQQTGLQYEDGAVPRLIIEMASEENEGLYVCETVPMGGATVSRTCRFLLDRSGGVTTASPTPLLLFCLGPSLFLFVSVGSGLFWQ